MAVDPSTARRNTVLAGLGGDDLAALLPRLHETPLALGQVLHEHGEPITAVHFPVVGVVSVLADLGDDQVVEAATIGREGIVGVSVVLGAGCPTERSRVQVPGRALTMGVEDLAEHLADVDGPLTARLRRSAQAMFTQVARNAACNRVHTVRQRAARWLLMTADRMDDATFDLTQHFLAQMLAVRRTSVSEVAQALAEEGCIDYTRGTITITDRPGLEAHACTCYEAIRRATDAAMAVR